MTKLCGLFFPQAEEAHRVGLKQTCDVTEAVDSVAATVGPDTAQRRREAAQSAAKPSRERERESLYEKSV